MTYQTPPRPFLARSRRGSTTQAVAAVFHRPRHPLRDAGGVCARGVSDLASVEADKTARDVNSGHWAMRTARQIRATSRPSATQWAARGGVFSLPNGNVPGETLDSPRVNARGSTMFTQLRHPEPKVHRRHRCATHLNLGPATWPAGLFGTPRVSPAWRSRQHAKPSRPRSVARQQTL